MTTVTTVPHPGILTMSTVWGSNYAAAVMLMYRPVLLFHICQSMLSHWPTWPDTLCQCLQCRVVHNKHVFGSEHHSFFCHRCTWAQLTHGRAAARKIGTMFLHSAPCRYHTTTSQAAAMLARCVSPVVDMGQSCINRSRGLRPSAPGPR